MVAIETDLNRNQKVTRPRSQHSEIGDHTSIYRYVSLHNDNSWEKFEKFLRDLKFKGSKIDSLNDPTEGSPHFVDDLDFNARDRIFSCFDSGESNIDTWDRNGSPDVSEIRRDTQSGINEINKSARLVSFSLRSDSPLLWAHYANSHKGVCIHIISGSIKRNKFSRGLVKYSSFRPSLPMSALARFRYIQKYCSEDEKLLLRTDIQSALFYTKPIEWSYEEEFRCIYNTYEYDDVQLSENSFIEIILGSRMGEAEITRIDRMCKKYLPQARVSMSAMSKRTFSVNILD